MKFKNLIIPILVIGGIVYLIFRKKDKNILSKKGLGELDTYYLIKALKKEKEDA